MGQSRVDTSRLTRNRDRRVGHRDSFRVSVDDLHRACRAQKRAANIGRVSGAIQRVLLVDDHPVVRLGLALALERAGGFAVCGEAGDVATVRERVTVLRPDCVVLDLALGGRDGIELLREILALHPGMRVLVFSAQPEQTYARRVFAAGGHGYLMKDDGVEKVPAALAAIARGERYASAAVQASLFQEFAGGGGRPLDPRDPVALLSTRELQVLKLLGTGRGLGELARELKLSVKTVGTHRERLKNKLGVGNARDLTRIAAELVRLGRV
jgi:two-component system, NarL family, invasion response regulator UvrY